MAYRADAKDTVLCLDSAALTLPCACSFVIWPGEKGGGFSHIMGRRVVAGGRSDVGHLSCVSLNAIPKPRFYRNSQKSH